MAIKFAGISRKYSKELSDSHSFKEWREFNKDSHVNFAIIPSGIKDYLSEFDNKSLSLYLYYCLHANNNTGESWHSTNQCAKNLGVTTRSINNWNNVLENLGLIFRMPNNHSSLSTFILPISNYISFLQNTTLKDYLVSHEENTIQKKFEGELKAIINVFQFRKNFETNEFTEPYNCWLLIFERKYKTDKKEFTVKKYVLLEKTGIEKDINFSFKNIKDDLYLNPEDEFSVIDYVRKNKITLEHNVFTNKVVINSKYDLKVAIKKGISKDDEKRANSYNALLDLFDAVSTSFEEIKGVEYIE